MTFGLRANRFHLRGGETIIIYEDSVPSGVRLQWGQIQSMCPEQETRTEGPMESITIARVYPISRPNSNLCDQEAVHHHSHHWACRLPYFP
jgi:hypothetical protein